MKKLLPSVSLKCSGPRDTEYYLYLTNVNPGDPVKPVVLNDPNGGSIAIDFDGNGRILGFEILRGDLILPPVQRLADGKRNCELP